MATCRYLSNNADTTLVRTPKAKWTGTDMTKSAATVQMAAQRKIAAMTMPAAIVNTTSQSATSMMGMRVA